VYNILKFHIYLFWETKLQWTLMDTCVFLGGICRLDRALHNEYRQWTCTPDQVHGNSMQLSVWLPNCALPYQCKGSTCRSPFRMYPKGVLHWWHWSGLLVPKQLTLWSCNSDWLALWPFLWGWVCVWDPILFQMFIRGTLTMHVSNLRDVAQSVWCWETKVLNIDWIKANTKLCPGCGNGVVKESGCNHMTCPCGQNFW
jgi:hypothetical protein